MFESWKRWRGWRWSECTIISFWALTKLIQIFDCVQIAALNFGIVRDRFRRFRHTNAIEHVATSIIIGFIVNSIAALLSVHVETLGNQWILIIGTILHATSVMRASIINLVFKSNVKIHFQINFEINVEIDVEIDVYIVFLIRVPIEIL